MKRKESPSSARRINIALLLIATFITASYWATSPPTVQALSSGVVISQVYGGGGNVGATFTHDFIELFNRGTTPVSLNGWSVQYTSATGTGNFGANTTLITPLPNVTLAPGQYFLIQEASQAAVGSPLPTPDVVDASPIAMAAGAGKVALVNTTTPLGCNGGSTPCSPAALATIVDLVGYGNANFFEGAAAPTLSNTTAAIRKMNGCTETDNNANDFMAATPTPRNTATALAPCNMDTAPAVSVTTPASGAANVGVAANIEITFSEAVNVTGTWFDIQGSVSGMHLATSSGGPTTFTLDPTVDFANNETVTVTVFAAQVSDQDANDPPDTMALNFTLSFTTIPPPPPTRAIHEIQGGGAASPFVNQLVLTNGIVTARKSNGFFLQEPDASVDADPDTSEGIFVFTSSLPAVAKGDAVTVTGQVTEFFNLTQVGRGGNPATFSVGSSGNVVPAAITFTTTILNPAGPLDQLERFEGMLMHADALVSVAPTNEFGEIFTVLDGVARPFREPGIEITLPVPPDPTSGVPDCCIPRWDLNPERIMVDSDGLVGSSSISVTSNVTFSNVTGPLDFTFSNYKVLPEAPPMTSANMSAIPVPAPAACEFTVAGYNIENFGNNATQRQKAALAIRTVMRYPDIIGHIEILNLASLQALAAQVNSDAVAAGDPDPVYQAFLIPAPAGGTQNVGFLVKTSRVQVNSVTQERATDTFINPNNGMPETLHDRPPLVLRATVDPMGAAPLPVIVMVNHTRSFIDIELVAGDGPRVRAKRKAQGESVAGLVQELQTNNPTTPLILVGDYNAYQFNDGYTDPISVIKGAPTPDDQIVVDESPDLVNPNLVNLTDMLPADQRYSFVFEGTPQALDHVLINTAAQSFFKGYAVARSNSDFPESLASDPSRPEKNSDHDMPVAYFRLPLAITNVSVDRSVLWPPNHKMVDVTVNYTTANNCGPVTCTLSVTSNEPVNGDDDGNTAPDWEVIDAHHVRLRAERSGSGTGRIYTITITCTDSMGGTATATATVSVPLNL